MNTSPYKPALQFKDERFGRNAGQTEDLRKDLLRRRHMAAQLKTQNVQNVFPSQPLVASSMLQGQSRTEQAQTMAAKAEARAMQARARAKHAEAHAEQARAQVRAAAQVQAAVHKAHEAVQQQQQDLNGLRDVAVRYVENANRMMQTSETNILQKWIDMGLRVQEQLSNHQQLAAEARSVAHVLESLQHRQQYIANNLKCL